MINFLFLKFFALMSSHGEPDACKWILEKMEIKGYQVFAGRECFVFPLCIIMLYPMIEASKYVHLSQSYIDFSTPTFNSNGILPCHYI